MQSFAFCHSTYSYLLEVSYVFLGRRLNLFFFLFPTWGLVDKGCENGLTQEGSKSFSLVCLVVTYLALHARIACTMYEAENMYLSKGRDLPVRCGSERSPVPDSHSLIFRPWKDESQDRLGAETWWD